MSEIGRYLYASLAHSITVDVVEIEEASGTLRTVTIRNDLSVTIEFPPALEYVTGDFEGGGLKYRAIYDRLEDIVDDLQDFLGKPIAEWRNFTESPYEPSVVEAPDPMKNLAFFEDQVRTGKVRLPRKGRYRLAGIHWRHIELYGEYRQDKLGEETELAIQEYPDEDEPV